MRLQARRVVFFFFNDTATTEIYTLSLHDALPISQRLAQRIDVNAGACARRELALHQMRNAAGEFDHLRSEEHTSELQSQSNLVCRLLLEKKKEESFFIVVNKWIIVGEACKMMF